MTIFTSHQLSNVYLASRIIVLENGEVIEDGTHADLLKTINVTLNYSIINKKGIIQQINCKRL